MLFISYSARTLEDKQNKQPLPFPFSFFPLLLCTMPFRRRGVSPYQQVVITTKAVGDKYLRRRQGQQQSQKRSFLVGFLFLVCWTTAWWKNHPPTTTEPQASTSSSSSSSSSAFSSYLEEPLSSSASVVASSLTLTFLGDVAFRAYDEERKRFVKTTIDLHQPIAPSIQSLLHASDWTVAHLESSVVSNITLARRRNYVSNEQEPLEPKQDVARKRPQAWFASDVQDLRQLYNAGVSAVSVANNHFLDSLVTGDVSSDGNVKNYIDESIDLIRSSGLNPLFGTNDNDDDDDDDYVENNINDQRYFTMDTVVLYDVRIAVFTTNAAQDLPYSCEINTVVEEEEDIGRLPCLLSSPNKDGSEDGNEMDLDGVLQLAMAVEEAEASHDLVIVLIHWGENPDKNVQPWQTKLSQLIPGQMMVGHQTQRLQGISLLDRSLYDEDDDDSSSSNDTDEYNNADARDHYHHQHRHVYYGQFSSYGLGSTLWPLGGESHSSALLQVKVLLQDGIDAKPILQPCLIPTVMRNGQLQMADRQAAQKTEALVHQLSQTLAQETNTGTGSVPLCPID